MSSNAPSPFPTLQSFFLGGFECATHRRRDRQQVDVIAATHHDTHAAEDYTLLAQAGIRTVRDGLRWHLIETTPGAYDWSSFLPQLDAALHTGTQVIWDLCHWGVPAGLDPLSADFPPRFAAFATAAARLIRQRADDAGRSAPTLLCPINEISFWAWVGGDEQHFFPYLQQHGPALKAQLVEASRLAIHNIRTHDPTARFIQAEPLIHITYDPKKPQDRPDAERFTAAQFEVWDMLATPHPTSTTPSSRPERSEVERPLYSARHNTNTSSTSHLYRSKTQWRDPRIGDAPTAPLTTPSIPPDESPTTPPSQPEQSFSNPSSRPQQSPTTASSRPERSASNPSSRPQRSPTTASSRPERSEVERPLYSARHNTNTSPTSHLDRSETQRKDASLQHATSAPPTTTPSQPNQIPTTPSSRPERSEVERPANPQPQTTTVETENLLDIIGVNYYWNNQWIHKGDRTPPGHPLHRPFHQMLLELWNRYRKPILITETGAEAEAAPGWLGYIAAEVRQAQRLGIPILGICLYPITDYPGWDDNRHCTCGLLQLSQDWTTRSLHQDLLTELKAQQKLLPT